MKYLALLIVAASTALAVPPIAPPTRTVPIMDPCYHTLVWTVDIIMRMEERGEITAEERRGLIRWAMEEFARCKNMPPARPPYSERRGDEP